MALVGYNNKVTSLSEGYPSKCLVRLSSPSINLGAFSAQTGKGKVFDFATCAGWQHYYEDLPEVVWNSFDGWVELTAGVTEPETAVESI